MRDDPPDAVAVEAPRIRTFPKRRPWGPVRVVPCRPRAVELLVKRIYRAASHRSIVPSCAEPTNMAAQLDRVSRVEGGEDGIRIGAVATENEKTGDSSLQQHENVIINSYLAHVENFPRSGPRAQLLRLSGEKKLISKRWLRDVFSRFL